MITKAKVKEAAQNLYSTEHGRTSFEVGAMWVLSQLDLICNDSATLIEQFKNDFTIIPGTHAAIYWPNIEPKYKFATVDYYGRVEAYEFHPCKTEDAPCWTQKGGYCISLFTINGEFENWQELIFERPE